MDGYQLGAELRQRSTQPIRLIALTGYGLASDIERSKAAGFEGHFVKPVDFDALLAALGSVAAQAPAGAR
jgi:CheY-like chemotaxis protein